MAAVFEPRIQAVRGERMLLSYQALALSDRYTHNASTLIKDGLLHGDLPQIAALCAPRPVTLASLVDPMKRVVDRTTAQAAYRLAGNVTIA